MNERPDAELMALAAQGMADAFAVMKKVNELL